MDSSSSLMIRVQETPELYFPVRHTSHVCLPWFAYTGKMPNDWASLAKIQKNWECFYSVRWPRFLLWQSEIMPSNNNDKTWTVGSRFCRVQLLLLLGSRVFLLIFIKQNWHLCMVDSETFLNKENLWGRAEILNHLEFSQHNFINTSMFFIKQSTKGKNSRLHIVLIYMSSQRIPFSARDTL